MAWAKFENRAHLVNSSIMKFVRRECFREHNNGLHGRSCSALSSERFVAAVCTCVLLALLISGQCARQSQRTSENRESKLPAIYGSLYVRRPT